VTDVSIEVPPGGDPGNLPDLSHVWTRALAELSDGSLSAQQRAWLRITKPLALVDDTAVLAAPNEFTKELLDSRLRQVLASALSSGLGRPIGVAVTVQRSADPEPLLDDAEEPPPPALPLRHTASPARRPDPAKLNPKYVFDTFVIGDSN